MRSLCCPCVCVFPRIPRFIFFRNNRPFFTILCEHYRSGYYPKHRSAMWEAERLSVFTAGVLPKICPPTWITQPSLITVRLIVPSPTKARNLPISSKVSTACSQPNCMPCIELFLIFPMIHYSVAFCSRIPWELSRDTHLIILPLWKFGAKSLVFGWVHDHMSLSGNEAGNATAKEAAKHGILAS